MAYKKKVESKDRAETVFDVKGELTFWVKTGSNGKLYASTSVKIATETECSIQSF